MIESSNKRKHSSSATHETVAKRGVINANWQQLLKTMDKPNDKTHKEQPKQQFTGTFRRNRRKKASQNASEINIHSNLKTLTIIEPPSTENRIIDFTTEKIDVSAKNLTNNAKHTANNSKKLTKFIAMDCEMVGIGFNGEDHMLARVSLVNKFGDCIYDKFVKAREEVKDYRTEISGIRKEDMLNGEDFSTVQKEVSELLKGRILVGHSLKNDLSVLFLSHPKRSIRDTSKYKPFKKITKGSTPSLKRLSKEVLGLDIQQGEHSSVEDARAVMQLYCTVANKWEETLGQKRGHKKEL